MSRVITGLCLLAIGIYVISNGGISLLMFLWLIGVLAFYEVQSITELRSQFLMVINMIFYTLLMGFLYQGEPSFGLPYFGLMLACSALLRMNFLKKSYCFEVLVS